MSEAQQTEVKPNQSSTQSTNMVSVELMVNSAINADALVAYCNKRFSAYQNTRIRIEEYAPGLLSVKSDTAITYMFKGQPCPVMKYNLCGMCLEYESRERKAVKRHFEASCIHLHPNPHMPARDMSLTSGVKRSAPAENDDYEELEDKLVADEFDIDNLSLSEAMNSCLAIILRVDSRLDPIRIERYANRRFGDLVERASTTGAAAGSGFGDAGSDSAMNLPPLSELQVTIREDHVLEGALDVRFNFDLTFHRQMMGPESTRRFFVCGKCFKYETLKKTHMDRHVDSRTCLQKQPPRERSEPGDVENAVKRALVRRCIVPVTRDEATPALLKRLKQETWPVSGYRVSSASRALGSKAARAARVVESSEDEPIVVSCGNAPIIINLGEASGTPLIIESPEAPVLVQYNGGAQVATSSLQASSI